jgi:hypothetical protein
MFAADGGLYFYAKIILMEKPTNTSGIIPIIAPQFQNRTNRFKVNLY